MRGSHKTPQAVRLKRSKNQCLGWELSIIIIIVYSATVARKEAILKGEKNYVHTSIESE